MHAWWDNAVVYQIYPRSFQDTTGDGIGDLPGVVRRLDHVAALGADAIWLSPFYPSPQADFGYDVADYTDVDPRHGTLDDADRLIAAAHERGLRVLFDLVPSHTSIEHPWFRERPERYVWADGPEPPNNWISVFGGPAWSRDERTGRWYLHSFLPEQPDLDWRHPEVPAEMARVVRFWLDRGVDGFRVDAVHRMMKDPGMRDDPVAAEPFPLPLNPGVGELANVHSQDHADMPAATGALREAAGEALLVGEVYLPSERLAPYLDAFDVCFSFSFLHSAWEAEVKRAVIAEAVALGGVAWVNSNHDFARVPTRLGAANARAAALLLLTLPGTSFVYQGEELGLADGPGHDPPLDRVGRDAHRHPMPWEPGPGGGFTTGEPWLAVARGTPASQQRDRQDSVLELYRQLIALRRELGGDFELLDAPEGVLAFARGDHRVAVNFTGDRRPAPWSGRALLATAEGGDGQLAPHAAAVFHASG